jgi:dihydrofolate synthase/folylpolyglutamate synthase
LASAEEILRKREVLGWRLGLERMRRLCSLLGMPQNRFASIHVVGTNGKTSVALMTAALLEAHGVRAGAYTSPHIRSWRERIVIGGESISEAAFDEAVDRAEQAAEAADRSAGEEGPVTQFELLTAAAFVAFAEARVQYAVIEAGLGGRLDATNVIPSKLTVLTSVGLDHTEYLGETKEDIAAEKLAVVRDHTTLILGEVPPEVQDVVEEVFRRRHAVCTRISIGSDGPIDYQSRNLVLAEAVVSEVLGRSDPEARQRALSAGSLQIPGRAEVVPGNPRTIFDAAHNPQGALALVELLPTLAGGQDVVCCLAVLAEKDAQGIVEALAQAVERFVCTEVPPEAIEGSGRPGGSSHPAPELAELCRKAGVEAEEIPEPLEAWRRTRELAVERDGVALAAGSHYLLSCLWTERPAASS